MAEANNNDSSPAGGSGTQAQSGGTTRTASTARADTVQETPAPATRRGTITLEALQEELGDEKGREEYLRYGRHFGVTATNVANYHPPLDLDSITEEKE